MRVQPHDTVHDRAFDSVSISAEAVSEFARGPSYDELWRDSRRGRTREAPAPRKSDRAPVAAALLATLLGAMALIGLREKIVSVAPPAAAVYSAIGLPVNLSGLELRGVRSRITMEGERKVLAIEGEIVNLRRDANPVPPVALTVRADNGTSKYSWTARAPKGRLDPGETVAFRARLAAPPEGASDVLVRFASHAEMTSKSASAAAGALAARLN
jgi:hypothetical protein